MTLIVIILCLSACRSKKEDNKPAYDLGGKTYYNTVDDFGHDEHAKVWFGKNGTFVLNDSYSGGYYELSGTWTLNENVCTLEVDKSDSGISKIIFEVEDNNTLKLKTTLQGSRSDQIFSTTKTSGSNTSNNNNNTNNNSGTDTNNNTGSSGNSETKPEEAKPETDTKPKEDTSTKNVPCTGISALYNNYWAYEGVKNWDLEIKVTPADTTDKITYKSNDEGVVKVDENGNATTVNPGKTTIDITCGSQKLTIGFETRSKTPTEYATLWQSRRTDVAEAFLPNVYFDGKGNFVFKENLYAGMGEYKGTYVKDDSHYTCKVTSAFEGFAGDDVKEIVFKIVDDTTIKLKTQLCMSAPGDLFDLVP